MLCQGSINHCQRQNGVASQAAWTSDGLSTGSNSPGPSLSVVKHERVALPQKGRKPSRTRVDCTHAHGEGTERQFRGRAHELKPSFVGKATIQPSSPEAEGRVVHLGCHGHVFQFLEAGLHSSLAELGSPKPQKFGPKKT